LRKKTVRQKGRQTWLGLTGVMDKIQDGPVSWKSGQLGDIDGDRGVCAVIVDKPSEGVSDKSSTDMNGERQKCSV
jgi:hypothetical protein